jgi:hypothetical protein
MWQLRRLTIITATMACYRHSSKCLLPLSTVSLRGSRWTLELLAYRGAWCFQYRPVSGWLEPFGISMLDCSQLNSVQRWIWPLLHTEAARRLFTVLMPPPRILNICSWSFGFFMCSGRVRSPSRRVRSGRGAQQAGLPDWTVEDDNNIGRRGQRSVNSSGDKWQS